MQAGHHSRSGGNCTSWVAMLQEATAPEAAVQQAPVEAPTASPMSPTQGLVMNGPASARTMADSTQRPSGSTGRQAGGQQAAPRMVPPIAQAGSARDQVRPPPSCAAAYPLRCRTDASSMCCSCQGLVKHVMCCV